MDFEALFNSAMNGNPALNLIFDMFGRKQAEYIVALAYIDNQSIDIDTESN